MTNYHNYQYSPQYSQYPAFSNQAPQMDTYYRPHPQQQQFHQNYYYAQQQHTVHTMRRVSRALHHPSAPFQYSTSPWPTVPNGFQQQTQRDLKWNSTKPLTVTQIPKRCTVTQNTGYSKSAGQFQYTNDLKRKAVEEGSGAESLGASKRSRVSGVPTSSGPTSEVQPEAFTEYLLTYPTSNRKVSIGKIGPESVEHQKTSGDVWQQFTAPEEEDPEITVLKVVNGASRSAVEPYESARISAIDSGSFHDSTSFGASSGAFSLAVKLQQTPYSFLEPSQSPGEFAGAPFEAFHSSVNPAYNFLEPSQSFGASSEAPGNSGHTVAPPTTSYSFLEPSQSPEGLQWHKVQEPDIRATVPPSQTAPQESNDTVDSRKCSTDNVQSYMYEEQVEIMVPQSKEPTEEVTVAQLEADGRETTTGKDIIDMIENDEWSFDSETDEEFLARFFQPVEK